MPRVSASENNFVWFERSGQSFDDIGDMPAPLFFALLFQGCIANIALIGSLLVREVAQFHRFDDTIDNESRPEAGSKTQEEHFAAPETAQSLHGRVVDNFDVTAERGCEVETNPSASQVVRL